ncbi:hypothetical protein BCON_0088g00200 [Botryotinia convoluta]|uniref:Gfo/Idh/MocA-like oxidoreductase C-terminal domain-containing protein n=1 Tax=Botryotinia convoluta TaxID=54673 RepID=A0A4Z1I215_9HELO|nr:hypothetical protein BCON_0088g00200 [Botryotinia convoluta]
MTSGSTEQPISIAIIGSGLIGPRHAQSIDPSKSTGYSAFPDRSCSTCNPDCDFPIDHLPFLAPLPSLILPATNDSPNLPPKPYPRSYSHLLYRSWHKIFGHHRRFNPYLISAKTELDSGVLGQIIGVQGIRALKKSSLYFDGIGEWRRNGESGGVVLINLIHEFELLQYLLGKITTVSAIESKKTRGFDAEEGGAIKLRFESGVVGTFLLSDAVPSPWNFEAGTGENPTVPKLGKENGAGGLYRILGTRGGISVPDLTRWSYEVGEGEKAWNDELMKDEIQVNTEIVPFDEQIKHLVQVVKEGNNPICSGEEGLSAMVVCEAVRVAMKSGEMVEIEGLDIVKRSSKHN